MRSALMTVHSEHGPPTIEEAARRLGVKTSALDPGFGVVLLDPDKCLYSVLLQDAEDAKGAEKREGAEGPFSNPPIGPFGQPRS